MKRGDVVLCVIAGDYGKPRPAVVIQSDLYNPTHYSVSVLPITSHLVDAPLFRVDLKPGKQNGLRKNSQVMVDKITAIRRDRIKESIGRLSPGAIAKIEECLEHFLDLSA
ncbi:type II toxin-antitoxin system PemK/MazF family toxin [Puniceicoccus vermicola]|uniref:Type II toxin-antitoxin system PemK/MazF family toxin n=1 Tax=Puniceicoccus vermicola TaxID=388746 RepID=A0A7X1E380_9BACT|nr:type II toxin-antitoxin system PemK/MazF family toxin [Puniceicoccus vermicola]